MESPMPTPGLPNPIESFRMVQSVNQAAKPIRGFWNAVQQLLDMPRDKRYQMSGWTRLGVPVLIAAIVLNFFFWNYLLAIPLLATVLERVLLALFSIAVYLMLSKELERYRKVLDYISTYERRGVSPPS
jgi:hypothetical protein